LRSQYYRRQAELAARLAEHAATPGAAARLKAFAIKYHAKAEKAEAEEAAAAQANPVPPPHVIDGSSDEPEQK
jgi:hypothetical protein